MSRPYRSISRCARLVLALAVVADVGCLKVPAGELEGPSDAADAPKDTKTILDRYVQALGGEEALRKIAQRTVEARMHFLPEEGCTADDRDCRTQELIGNFTLKSTADQRLYRRTTIDKQIEEEGFDGKTGWQFRRGFLVLEDPEESAVTREDATLHWYLDLDKRGIELALEKPREKDFDGKARVLDGVRWSSKGDVLPPKTQWYDRATGLLVADVLEDDKSDPPISQHILYDDYRAVDGVQVAHRIRLINKIGARSQEIVFTTQRIEHAPIDADTFAIPKLPAIEKAPDERLDALTKAAEQARANPKDLIALVAHARAAWAAAHFEEAAAAAEVALKVDPKEAEALWILARVRVLQGRFKEAGPLLERSEKAGVKDVFVHAQRTWIASQQRDFQAVADALDKLGAANAPLAGRYRNFAGKPLQLAVKGDGCTAELPLVAVGSVTFVDLDLGGEKVRALIDTGASDVILDAAVAAKLKIPVRSRSALGQNGPEIGHGQLDALALGNANITGIPVDIFPHEVLAQMSGGVGEPPSAVLGSRILSLFQVTIDAPAKKLTLVNPTPKCKAALAARRSGARSAPFFLHETHFIYVLAKMNGSEGLYLVNTGMQGIALTATPKAFARAGIGAPPLRRDQAALVDINSFALGGAYEAVGLRGAYGYFEQEKSSDDFRIDGMLGLDLFTTGRLTIDYPEHKFYFGPTSAPAQPAAPASAPAPAKAP